MKEIVERIVSCIYLIRWYIPFTAATAMALLTGWLFYLVLSFCTSAVPPGDWAPLLRIVVGFVVCWVGGGIAIGLPVLSFAVGYVLVSHWERDVGHKSYCEAMRAGFADVDDVNDMRSWDSRKG
jgi:hypothetical protein